MNIFHFLSLYFPLLDVAFGPSFSGNADASTLDPATKIILIVVLVIFLVFIGYLIWKALHSNHDN